MQGQDGARLGPLQAAAVGGLGARGHVVDVGDDGVHTDDPGAGGLPVDDDVRGGMGSSQIPRRHTGDGLDALGAGVQLLLHLRRGQAGQAHMVVGVVLDRMSLSHGAGHQVRVLPDLMADSEEGHRDAGLGEYVQQLGAASGEGEVVVGQGNQLATAASSGQEQLGLEADGRIRGRSLP